MGRPVRRAARPGRGGTVIASDAGRDPWEGPRIGGSASAVPPRSCQSGPIRHGDATTTSARAVAADANRCRGPDGAICGNLGIRDDSPAGRMDGVRREPRAAWRRHFGLGDATGCPTDGLAIDGGIRRPTNCASLQLLLLFWIGLTSELSRRPCPATLKYLFPKCTWPGLGTRPAGLAAHSSRAPYRSVRHFPRSPAPAGLVTRGRSASANC